MRVSFKSRGSKLRLFVGSDGQTLGPRNFSGFLPARSKNRRETHLENVRGKRQWRPRMCIGTSRSSATLKGVKSMGIIFGGNLTLSPSIVPLQSLLFIEN